MGFGHAPCQSIGLGHRLCQAGDEGYAPRPCYAVPLCFGMVVLLSNWCRVVRHLSALAVGMISDCLALAGLPCLNTGADRCNA